MRITMADYGVGNLHSIKKALERSGATVEVVTDMSKLLDAGCIVFPGVGAFDKTIERILPFREGVRERLEAGVPCLGICIGMHIMFESSAEGTSPGIGFMKGRVVNVVADTIPHMGWNKVESEDPLLGNVPDKHFYFAHSFRAEPVEDVVIGTTEYSGRIFPTFFRKGNTYGCQFHPEKSGESGLKVVSNFIQFAEANL